MSSDTTNRPIRIHVLLDKTNPVRRALEQVFGLVGTPTTHYFVETVAEADLVVGLNVRDFEPHYTTSQQYVMIDFLQSKEVLPENVVKMTGTNGSNMVMELAELISRVGKTLQPIPVEASASFEEQVPLFEDALRILVIDDTPKNIASAKKTLAGHHVTTVTGYEAAMKILTKQRFDVVLTDLHLPMSSKTMGDKFRLGELVPYGMLLILEASRWGTRFVAVVTDLGHHDDPFSAAFDHYAHFPVRIEQAKVLMMHAEKMEDGSKDWSAALRRLTED
jgi:CheY-like chemotaxis protein